MTNDTNMQGDAESPICHDVCKGSGPAQEKPMLKLSEIMDAMREHRIDDDRTGMLLAIDPTTNLILSARSGKQSGDAEEALGSKVLLMLANAGVRKVAHGVMSADPAAWAYAGQAFAESYRNLKEEEVCHE